MGAEPHLLGVTVTQALQGFSLPTSLQNLTLGFEFNQRLGMPFWFMLAGIAMFTGGTGF